MESRAGRGPYHVGVVFGWPHPQLIKLHLVSGRVGHRARSGWVFFAGPTHPTPLMMRPPPAHRRRRRRAQAASWTTSAACSMTWRTSWTPCWSDAAHVGSAWALARTLTFTSGWAPLGEAQVSRAAGGGVGGAGAGDSPPDARGHEAGAGHAAQPLHKHNSCPQGPGRTPSLEDCLVGRPKGSGQMLQPCGCPSLFAAPCAITAGQPAHPPPGSAHCV